MASNARSAFDQSKHDVDRLLEIHSKLGGSEQGRRYQLEVLNKSAIVLITAIWEAYCEDIVAEGIEHLVTHAKDASALQKGIKKAIAKELKSDQHELAVWQVADNGWRTFLQKIARTEKDFRILSFGKGPIAPFQEDVVHRQLLQLVICYERERLTAEELVECFDSKCQSKHTVDRLIHSQRDFTT